MINTNSIFSVFDIILLLQLIIERQILFNQVHCEEQGSKKDESMNFISPIVETKLGKIKGKYLKVQLNETKEQEEKETTRIVAAYIGIPYASPPIGDLRFAAPIPLTSPWNGTYDATQPKASCMQPSNKPTSEDCLFL